MKQMDTDGNGKVTLAEFKIWWLVAEDHAHHHHIGGLDVEDSLLAMGDAMKNLTAVSRCPLPF